MVVARAVCCLRQNVHVFGVDATAIAGDANMSGVVKDIQNVTDATTMRECKKSICKAFVFATFERA
jgi:hypothetical protein